MNIRSRHLSHLLAVAFVLNFVYAASSQDTRPTTATTQSTTSPTVTARIWKAIDLDGPVLEDAPPFALFSPKPVTIRTLREQFEDLVDDDRVEGILLRIKNPEIDLAGVEELRAEIQRFRKGGKKVHALLADTNQPGYVIASSCDRIIIAPSGLIMLTGLHVEGLFLKNLLDTLGLEAQLISVGKYKDAGEPLTRVGWSQPAREAMEALANDLYEQMISLIASGRKLSPENVRQMIDEGPFTADEALKRGLVDELSYEVDLVDSLQAKGNAKIETMNGEHAASPAAQPFDLLGMMLGRRSPSTVPAGDKIAVIYASGPILSSVPDGGLFPQSIIVPDEMNEMLEECLKNKAIKAIVLRIDSPGGDATASDIIWRQIRRVSNTKPVVASMGGVAASGGYFIAMGANHIIAQPGTITGSIGVLGGKVVMQNLLRKINITSEVISRGKNAGILSPGTPFTEAERATMQRILVGIYEDFTTKVATSRGFPSSDVEEVAQGRVWTGRQALEAGLVDDLGGLETAIQSARDLAGLKPAQKVDLLIYPKEMTFQQMLEKIFSGGTTMTSPAVEPILSMLPLQLRRNIAMLSLFDSPRPLALMPFLISVK